jgi:hypothetical protein
LLGLLVQWVADQPRSDRTQSELGEKNQSTNAHVPTAVLARAVVNYWVCLVSRARSSIYTVFYRGDDFYLHNFTVTCFRHYYFEDDHESTGAKMMSIE